MKKWLSIIAAISPLIVIGIAITWKLLTQNNPPLHVVYPVHRFVKAIGAGNLDAAYKELYRPKIKTPNDFLTYYDSAIAVESEENLLKTLKSLPILAQSTENHELITGEGKVPGVFFKVVAINPQTLDIVPLIVHATVYGRKISNLAIYQKAPESPGLKKGKAFG